MSVSGGGSPVGGQAFSGDSTGHFRVGKQKELLEDRSPKQDPLLTRSEDVSYGISKLGFERT